MWHVKGYLVWRLFPVVVKLTCYTVDTYTLFFLLPFLVPQHHTHGMRLRQASYKHNNYMKNAQVKCRPWEVPSCGIVLAYTAVRVTLVGSSHPCGTTQHNLIIKPVANFGRPALTELVLFGLLHSRLGGLPRLTQHLLTTSTTFSFKAAIVPVVRYKHMGVRAPRAQHFGPVRVLCAVHPSQCHDW